MANTLIHLTRHVAAVVENNAKPYAVHTIRDGALRPITQKQLKDALYLTWANKETQEAQKGLQNAKIIAQARGLARALGAKVDWEAGHIHLEDRVIKVAV